MLLLKQGKMVANGAREEWSIGLCVTVEHLRRSGLWKQAEEMRGAINMILPQGNYMFTVSMLPLNIINKYLNK